MKKNRIIYWSATGLLCLMMLASAGFYLTQTETVKEIYSSLGFPHYLIYPLAFAKIMGAGILLAMPQGELKDLAYKGFFFDFVLAFSAHINAGDGGFVAALVALALLITSYIYHKKVFLSSSD